MARAVLRLRPDGIYEIVNQHRTRRLVRAGGAALLLLAVGCIVAAALTTFVGAARAFTGGGALAALGFAGLFARSRLDRAVKPVAVTIPLRAARPRLVAQPDGDAQDAGA